MQKLTDVVIIGGGVVGCFLAYRLALEEVTVTLVERDRVGAGASGASAGNVQPGEYEPIEGAERLNPLEVESLALHRRFLPMIKEDSGVDPLDHAVTYFYAALTESEAAHARRFASTLQRVGLQGEWIDGAAACQLEPRLAPEVLGGVLHHDCLQMDAQRFVEALSKAAQKHGAMIRHGEVVGFRRDGDGISGIYLQDGSVVESATLVLAMGAWTATAVSRWLGIAMPIEPHSLQKIHVRPAGPPPSCAVRWGGVNIVSRLDGLVHVGSKHDSTGFEAYPSADGRQWLVERFHAILPGVEATVVDAKAGLAATLPARMPMLGPVQGLDGLCLAVPSSNGFLLSAVLAHMLTDWLVHGREHPFMPLISPERVMQSAMAR